MLTISLLSLLCAAIATPTAGSSGLCATLGCSVHKTDGRACQCNFHCSAHHDCCADFSTVCPNQTDPCLDHKCKVHGGAASGGASAETAATDAAAKTTRKEEHKEAKEAKEVKEPKSHASGGNATASAKGGSSGAHEKPAKASGGGKEDGKVTHSHDKDEKKGHHEHATSGKAGGASSGASGAGGAGAGASSSSSTPPKASSDAKHEHDKHEHDKHEHVKSGHTGHVSWLIVLLACATAATVPITVSIVLILRARGVCCAPATAVHQRIGKPPETAAGLPTVPEGAEPAGFDGFDGATGDSAAPAPEPTA